jgi:hypothetical protein
MFDRHPEYAPQASDGYTSNYPSSTEEFDDSSSHYQRQWGALTTVQPYLKGEIPFADQQMGDLPQTDLPDEAPQHHYGSAGRLDARDYGHSVASTSWSEWQFQTPSGVEYSREGARADNERLQWTSLSTHASLGELDNFNNDDGAEDLDGVEEVNGMCSADYFGSSKLSTPEPSFTTENTLPAEGPDNVFLQGVLSREDGHHEALYPYTNQLLNRIEPLEHGFQPYMDATLDNPINSDHDDWSMPHNEMANAPQPSQDIGGQQQMEAPGIGPTNDFQYRVREDTPVFLRQTDFGSGSV